MSMPGAYNFVWKATLAIIHMIIHVVNAIHMEGKVSNFLYMYML